jgi:putative transcriptional regulator
MKANGWLSVVPDNELVFGLKPDTKWDQALAKMGIDPRMLSGDVGHA